MSQPVTSSPVRLSDLPEDVHNVLLTHLSARPRAHNWQAFASPHDLLSLLRARCPLSTLARTSFPSLSMCAGGGGGGGGESLVALDGGVVAALARELGPCLRALCLVVRPHDVPLTLRCAHLRALTIIDRYGDFDLPALLDATGPSLRSLDLQGYILPGTHVAALAAHCTRLEQLALQFKMCGEVLRDVWRRAGPSLRALALTGPFLTRGMYPLPDGVRSTDPLDEIAYFCTRVQVLRVEGFEGDAARLAERMGKRLRMVQFLEAGSCPLPEEIARMLVACPDVMVEAFVDADVVDTLHVLGPRVRVLHLRGVPVDGLAGAAAAVKNLEELHVHAGQGDECDLKAFFDAFLDVPSPLLSVVEFPHGVCTSDAIAAIAERLRHLERFSCAVPRITKGLFGGIASANARLKKVCVECVNAFEFIEDVKRRRRAEEEAIIFVSAFAECSALKELVLKTHLLWERSREIEAACRPLRGRDIDIFIGGVQYLV